MRLPVKIGEPSNSRQDKKHNELVSKLQETCAEVFQRDVKFYIQDCELESLKRAVLIATDYSTNNGETMHKSGDFSDMSITAMIQDIPKFIYKAMDKMYNPALKEFQKLECSVSYGKDCVYVHGKTIHIQHVTQEIEKLLVHLKTFETHSMDCGAHQTDEQTFNESIRDIEMHDHTNCIIFDSNENKLVLLSQDKGMLSNLRINAKAKMELHNFMKNSVSSTEHSFYQLPVGGHENIAHFQVKTNSGRDIKLLIYEGDILKAPVSCIVNAANSSLACNAGVAAAVAQAAGPTLVKELESHIKRFGKVQVGDIVITTAGNLKFRGVIHAVGPKWKDYLPVTQSKLQDCQNVLQTVILKCLDKVQSCNLKSIAISAIGSGKSLSRKAVH